MAPRTAARFRVMAILATLAAFAMIASPAKAASVTFETNEAAFDAAFPGLIVEDFEDINVGPGGVMGCPAPATPTSANACFDPGDIAGGLSIRDEGSVPDPANALAIAGPGFGGQVPDRVIVANYFVETYVVEFNPPVAAAGLSLVGYFNGGSCGIKVTSGDGDVDVATSTCSTGGTFLGVSSDEMITKIEIGTANAFLAEGLRAIKFGSPSTCSSGGLAGQTLAEQASGADINETGAVSGELHAAEGGAGPAEPAVHEVACVAAAAGA